MTKSGGNTSKPKGNAKKESDADAAQKPQRFSGSPINRLRLVRQMIRRCVAQMQGKDAMKGGVAELVRLLSLERELADEAESIREVKVTWVEPETVSSPGE